MSGSMRPADPLEFFVGPHLFRFEPPDVGYLRYGGDVDGRLSSELSERSRVFTVGQPCIFLLVDITNVGKVLTHRMLLQSVWGPEYGEESEYLRVYINRLRHKLEANPASPRYLLTEPAVGYRFVSPQ